MKSFSFFANPRDLFFFETAKIKPRSLHPPPPLQTASLQREDAHYRHPILTVNLFVKVF